LIYHQENGLYSLILCLENFSKPGRTINAFIGTLHFNH